jgi:hypothetical protein
MRRIVMLTAMVMLLTVVAGAEELTLQATKDARIFGHSSERSLNGGTCSRLRARQLKAGGAELVLMDFDRKAVREFVIKNKGKKFKAELKIYVRQVQGADKAEVEVAALDAKFDWTEGTKNQKAAEEGEATYLAAQHELKPWATAKGKKAGHVKALFYDRTKDKVLTVLNKKTLDVTPDDKGNEVSVEIDNALLKHLLSSKACRGIVIFTRTPGAIADFYSREQNNKRPSLVITAE